MKFYKITDEHLSQLEIDFNFVAVNPIFGSKFSSVVYFNHILPAYNSSGKLLSPSELGCALSHISIYKKIIEADQPAIIFESDIIPSDKALKRAIKLCENSNVEFIHLGRHPSTAYGTFFKGTKAETLNLFIVDPARDFYGAFAYYITTKTAKELLKYHAESIKLADSWASFFLTSTITPYHLPLFNHPPTRNEMHEERLSVSGTVYSLSPTSLAFFMRKFFAQKLSFFKFWNKSIKQKFDN